MVLHQKTKNAINLIIIIYTHLFICMSYFNIVHVWTWTPAYRYLYVHIHNCVSICCAYIANDH